MVSNLIAKLRSETSFSELSIVRLRQQKTASGIVYEDLKTKCTLVHAVKG